MSSEPLIFQLGDGSDGDAWAQNYPRSWWLRYKLSDGLEVDEGPFTSQQEALHHVSKSPLLNKQEYLEVDEQRKAVVRLVRRSG